MIPFNELYYSKLDIPRYSEHYALNYEKKEFLWRFLQKLPRHSKLVELGVCNGTTALMLAYVAKMLDGSYTGIDNWSLEGTKRQVEEMLENGGLRGELIEGNTHAPENLREYDFLLIDAGHDEMNVVHDCDLWLPEAKKGAVVAFDDYPSHYPLIKEEDAHWAVKHYADWYTSNPYRWALLGYFDGLLIKQKVGE